MIEANGSMSGEVVNAYTLKRGAIRGEMTWRGLTAYDAGVLGAVAVEMPKGVAVTTDEVGSSGVRRGVPPWFMAWGRSNGRVHSSSGCQLGRIISRVGKIVGKVKGR
jgi:hypothetical protein